MKYLLVAGLLFSGFAGYSQGTQKNFSAKVPVSLYAIMGTKTSASTTSIDTTYLSSTDFTGTGTVADPIRIKTSAIQTWLESLPGFTNNGSKYLASDFTWKTIQTTNSITPLNAPVLTATAVSSSAISLTWTDVANEISYLLQRSQDNASWVTIATPAANTTQFTNSGLAASTLYYYRIKAIGDNTTYADSPFDGDNETTLSVGPPSPTTAENILFDVANSYQVQQHPDGQGTYYSSEGSGLSQALKKLPAGADGIVYFKYLTGSGELLSLGYRSTNVLQGSERWIGGIYLHGAQVKAIGYNGSKIDLGVTAIDNHLYGFRRNGSVIEIVTSTDATNWTVLGGSNYSADDLYIQVYFQTTTSKIKVFGLNLASY